MRKSFELIFVILLVIFFISSCGSIGVNMYGKGYFANKKEADLIKYFGYNGVPVDGGSEYDRVVYFTNKSITYSSTMTTVKRYKASNSETVFIFSYSEHNDGCLIDLRSRTRHYNLHGVPRNWQVSHSNDNAIVRSTINQFNSEVRRLKCIDPEYVTEYFNNSNIGDWFFVSQINQKFDGSSGFYDSVSMKELYPSETYVIYTLIIERINIVADDRAETEQHIAAIYNERLDSFYDGDGNTISEERAQAICNWYEEEGFKITTTVDGLSLIAYIKDGKVVKIE
jgi:hypothetical protein